MSIDSSTPILTSINATDPSYGAPNSANVICNPAYGLSTIWSGPGGTFEVRPTGNLLSLATLEPAGIVYLLTPGSEFVTLDLTGGTGVGITQSGRNFIISVLPNTTVQQITTKLNGDLIGNSSVINFIPGSGMGITGVASGGEIDFTFTSSNEFGTGHFVTTQTDSDLPNSFSLGSLSSGILKVSVSSGVATPARAIGNTDYMLVNSKMTDLYNSTPTAGSLFYYTGGHWNSIAPGTTGYVLTALSSSSIGWQPSGGGGSPSTWSQYAATQNVSMGGFAINNLLDPTSAQQAATKAYVDAHSGGAPVGATYLTSTANSTLTSEVNLGALSTGLLLGTVSSGISTISSLDVSTFVNTASTQTVTGAKTFTILPQSTAVPSAGADLLNKTYGDATYAVIGSGVSLSGTNAWTGTNSFNTNLPTSTATPTSGSQLITKTYADGAYAASGSGVSLGGTNAWTGTNSFNTNLPTSTVTPTSSTQLITKAYADATFATSAGQVSLNGTNAWTGTNSYNVSLPTSSLTPTASNQLITKAYGDANYTGGGGGGAPLNGNNAWTGTNSYEVNLPTSSLTATIGTQFVTKGYVEGHFPSYSYIESNFGQLTQPNAWQGVNTFNTNLPTSSLTPTQDAQFITRIYADGRYVTSSFVAANYVTYIYAAANLGQLAGSNAWTNTNTFNSALPTSTITPTQNAQLITKVYGDTTYQAASTAVTASSNVAWSGFNTYNFNLPTSSLTPTAGNQFITKAYGDANYTGGGGGGAPLGGNNVWTGTNSYNTNLPTSSLTPTLGSQLVTKTYTDATYAGLGNANTWTNTNTFNGTTIAGGTTLVATSISSKLIASGFTGSQLVTKQAGVQTTNATPTLLFSLPLGTNETVTMTGTVTGASTDHSDNTGGFFCVTAGRGSGNIALTSTPFPIINSTSTGIFTITADVGSQAILVTVTGISSTYNWVCNYNYQKVLLNS